MAQLPQRLQFPPRGTFIDTLKARVDAYFEAGNRKPTGNAYLYFKAVFGYALMIGSYLALVFWVDSWWSVVLGCFLLVQGQVLVAFNVMHDGCHGSFSSRRSVNWLMGATMDVLGGSNMLWRQKHNQLHHTYTNIDGKDDDIAIGALMRLAPTQEWKPWHRLQALYAPVLYSMLTLYLVFYSDWNQVISNKIGNTPLQPRAKWELPYFFATKLAYFSVTLVLPMFFHAWWIVLLCFIGCHLLFGLILSLVFQLAHTVEGVDFPVPDPKSGALPDEWAVHQVKTTADFAPSNWFATFYMGGLNFQVEHHLFHKVSHVHYPALAKIVRATCDEFSVPHRCFPSVRAALVAHFRFLAAMGVKPRTA